MQAPQPPHDDPIVSFYRACGVTVALHNAPQNRFEEAEPRPEPVHHQREALPPPPAAPAAPDLADEGEAAADARSTAATAQTLDALHEALRMFGACPLKASARQAVVGEGPVGAPLMLVGEAPGRDEDEAGRPFVGRSGKLLERMLAAIGFGREDVYISNAIPWRPPANRTPTPIETATCEPFIRREIQLVRPKILVPLGGASAKLLLRTTTGIVRLRGRWVRYTDGSFETDALPTFHPAYLLRTPGEKRRAWQDLLSLRERLEAQHGFASPGETSGSTP